MATTQHLQHPAGAFWPLKAFLGGPLPAPWFFVDLCQQYHWRKSVWTCKSRLSPGRGWGFSGWHCSHPNPFPGPDPLSSLPMLPPHSPLYLIMPNSNGKIIQGFALLNTIGYKADMHQQRKDGSRKVLRPPQAYFGKDLNGKERAGFSHHLDTDELIPSMPSTSAEQKRLPPSGCYTQMTLWVIVHYPFAQWVIDLWETFGNPDIS